MDYDSDKPEVSLFRAARKTVSSRLATQHVCAQLKKLQWTSKYATRVANVSERKRGKTQVQDLLQTLRREEKKQTERRKKDIGILKAALVPLSAEFPFSHEGSSTVSLRKPCIQTQNKLDFRRYTNLSEDWTERRDRGRLCESSLSPKDRKLDLRLLPGIQAKSIGNLASLRAIDPQSRRRKLQF